MLGNTYGVTHGMHRSPTYTSWRSMIRRCTAEAAANYHLYGGRGITVCERWRKFEGFLEDMGERPADRTLDRIDNNGNYEPGNCRWATRSEQQKNKRPAKRREVCKRGHVFAVTGVYETIRGRQCKACALDRARKRQATGQSTPRPPESTEH